MECSPYNDSPTNGHFSAGLAAGQQQEPEILLGHYCAIITSMSLSAGGRMLATTDRCAAACPLTCTAALSLPGCACCCCWVATTTGTLPPACLPALVHLLPPTLHCLALPSRAFCCRRDQRVRVSLMPADPMAGAHEIQSYCFGHSAFVACCAFAQQQEGGQVGGRASRLCLPACWPGGPPLWGHGLHRWVAPEARNLCSSSSSSSRAAPTAHLSLAFSFFCLLCSRRAAPVAYFSLAVFFSCP